jgi:iron complex outermembrane receptor protein
MHALHTRRTRVAHLPLALAVVAGLHGGPVRAQDSATAASAVVDEATRATPSPTADDTKKAATQLDAVSVTGSLLRRADYEATSPIQTIDVNTSVEQGNMTLANVLQRSAMGGASTQITNQFGGFVVDGGLGVQTISLRGLGSKRTLVLLNGQRPGPAGVRGAVGSFDLNVIPNALLRSIEIVKDGASSIYGSDAVAGAVNLITRRDITRPELEVRADVPLAGAGEQFGASLLAGWKMDAGSIVVAGDVSRQNSVTVGDRRFLQCQRPLIRGADGRSIDLEDRSITAGTSLSGCQNLLINAIIEPGTSNRYVPSTDGTTVGPFAGYRPNRFRRHSGAEPASSEEVLNFERYNEWQIINQVRKATGYLSTDFSFGGINWQSQWLVNRREAEHAYWQQFYPLVSAPGTRFNQAIPVIPLPMSGDATVTFFHVSNRLDSLLPGTNTWAWQLNTNYSRSSGDYGSDTIVAARTGDLSRPGTGVPVANYFAPGFLDGTRSDELKALLVARDNGSTLYTQATASALFTGDLFSLPAGSVGAAFGLEYRTYAIDDQPGELSRTGGGWATSSAQATRGRDRVVEGFTEIEVPLIKGIPLIESLTANGSGRIFRYNSVGSSDKVWKLGLNWQINSWLRMRGSLGTSYRAPGLYELYLGNQTAFAPQAAVDPCVRWGESTRDFLRANCAALGIPDTFNGAATSAVIYSQGGAGELVPEKSRSRSAGVVLTPAIGDMNIAFDYFDYDIRDEIAQLSAGSIVGGCYDSVVYPNRFCSQFTRGPRTDDAQAFVIGEIQSPYLNINRQRTRGYDLAINTSHSFGFGTFTHETRATYTLSDRVELFDSAGAEGRRSSQLVGSIGRPKLSASTQLGFKRGDWSAQWLNNYVGATENPDLSARFSNLGYADAQRDIRADARIYHTAAVTYRQTDWSLTVGVRNLFNREPDTISGGVEAVYGNVPVDATQYDLLGRSVFARATYRF